MDAVNVSKRRKGQIPRKEKKAAMGGDSGAALLEASCVMAGSVVSNGFFWHQTGLTVSLLGGTL
jgi:hypothetical protein